MKYKIAINGFGRIGRLTFRSLIERDSDYLEIVAVNDLGSLESNLHLLKFDSVHGQFKESINLNQNHIEVKNNKIKFLKEADPSNLNWGDLGVDLVIECTGIFTKREDAEKHLQSEQKKF